jgi:hypothetical protein
MISVSGSFINNSTASFVVVPIIGSPPIPIAVVIHVAPVAPETPLAPVPGGINARLPCVSANPNNQPLVEALWGKVNVTVPVVGDLRVMSPD